jgi:hypothetical protein
MQRRGKRAVYYHFLNGYFVCRYTVKDTAILSLVHGFQ